MAHPVYRADSVVLVHGLYMARWAMAWLGRGLNRAGWRCHAFGYASVLGTLAQAAASLYQALAELPGGRVHLVGHSLGGLVIHQLLAGHPELPPGRVVTLGTPHQGSYVAKRLSAHTWSAWLLGRSMESLVSASLPPWPEDRELGVIAGTMDVGIGRIVPGVPRPNDGTVAVAETRLQGMRDHITLPLTHSGLLISSHVAEQIDAFLNHGRFRHGVGG